MDNRKLNIGLEDHMDEAAKDKFVAVCKHVIAGDESEYLHLDYDETQELLAVQCHECSKELYEDCDFILKGNYSLLTEELSEHTISFYAKLMTQDERYTRDFVLICKHEGNTLRESFERLVSDGSN